jgi:peptidoglycan/LPS O-acetylase OafA/YrhL
MTKRFFRIFPLYVIITLLYFILFREGGLISLGINLTLLQGIVPPFYGSIIPPGWSLTNEWTVYFIFPFLLYISFKTKYKNIIYPIGAAALMIFICCYRSHLMNLDNYERLKYMEGFQPNINFTRGISSFIRTMVAYHLGILSFFIYRNDVKIPFLNFLIVPLLALLFVSGSDIFVIISLPIFIYCLTKDNALNKFLSSRVVYFLGLISYSLYVNHYLFMKTYDYLANLVGVRSNTFSLSYVFLGTLFFSVFTYYLIEKPGLNYFKKHSLKINRFSQSVFQPLSWKKRFS